MMGLQVTVGGKMTAVALDSQIWIRAGQPCAGAHGGAGRQARTGRVDAGPEQRKQLQTRPSLLKFRQCN
jgi:hypothetical protein